MQKRLHLFILALLMLTLLLASCSPFKKLGNAKVYNSPDGSLSVATKGSLPWPKSEMGNLPEFKGNIEAKATNDGITVMTIADVKKADLDAYVSQVKSMGFTPTLETDTSDYYMLLAEKDDHMLSLQYAIDGDKGTLILSYQD
ncbi:MAG: hypothetical protein FWG21_07135 [Oscillospiraceae bacterium]|nr:hypothetical protein [Oscillospiraceae bacterium]